MGQTVGLMGKEYYKDKDGLKNLAEMKILFLLVCIFPIVFQKILGLALELNKWKRPLSEAGVQIPG